MAQNITGESMNWKKRLQYFTLSVVVSYTCTWRRKVVISQEGHHSPCVEIHVDYFGGFSNRYNSFGNGDESLWNCRGILQSHVHDVLEQSGFFLCVGIATMINIFFPVEIAFLFYMEKRITVPIEKLAHLANNYVQLGGENLNSQDFIDACTPYVNDNMEVGNLAKSYVRMITDLEVYMEHLTKVTAEKERIGAELDVATHI